MDEARIREIVRKELIAIVTRVSRDDERFLTPEKAERLIAAIGGGLFAPADVKALVAGMIQYQRDGGMVTRQ